MKIIEELEGLVSSKLSEVATLIALIKLETRLAVSSIIPLLLNVFMLFIILISFWLSTLTLIGYCAFLAFNSTLYALLLVLVLNIGFLWGLVKYLQFNIQNMSFEKTRNYFNENTDYELQKKLNCPNTDD